MSQQSEIAGAAYLRLQEGPLPLARLVLEIRNKWGGSHGVREVHRFAQEVATCLLRDDVEIGNLSETGFVPWKLELWDADEKIDQELMSMADFFDDERLYVFRMRK